MLHRCPICSSNDSKRIHSQEVGDYLYYYSVCRNCGFVYQHERYPVEHYTKLPYQSPRDYIEHAKNRAGYIYDFVSKYTNTADNLDMLDIGCGKGAVMYCAKKIFPNIRTATGYTLDMGETPFDKRLNIIYKNFEDLIITDCAFDFVIMSHILEHFYDPVKAMNNVWKITKPTAFVYVEVPNLYWTEIRIPSVFSPEHLSYFTLTSLQNVFLQTGFVPIKIKASHYWGNIKALLYKWPTHKKIKKEKWVEQKYNWVKLLYPYYRKRLNKAGPND